MQTGHRPLLRPTRFGDIEYHLDGPENAPMLILSNALGTDMELWQPQLSALSPHYRLLRYNLRGQGGTPLPLSQLTLRSLGGDVLTLMDHLGVAEASFCGIGLGALIGMWLNRHHPQRLSQLIVVSGAARIGRPQEWINRAQRVRREGVSAEAAAAPARWFTHAWRQHHPLLVTEMIASLDVANPAGYAACCEVLASADLLSDLPLMPRPMLVISATEDSVTPPDEGRLIASRAPDATLVSLAGSHLVSVSNADFFNRVVLDFLSGVQTHQRDGRVD